MHLMTELNRRQLVDGKKRISPAAVHQMENGIYKEILSQMPIYADLNEDSWTSISAERHITEDIADRLLAMGVTRKELDTEDAFVVSTVQNGICIYSESECGLIYGAYEVLQQAQADNGFVPGGIRFAVPQCPFRALKIYLPGEKQLAQFYKIVDMLLYYRYNTVIIEVGGAMEYKHHPEINESWIEYCTEMRRYPERADEVQNMFGWVKNSIHFENGDGSFLPQETVSEMVKYCKDRGMNVVPEVPCLSHSDYLLNAHPELSERPYDPFPDTYCPSNPESYKLLFEIMDEVIDVFQPKMMHIGHDEFYTYGLCEKCKQRSAADILAGDITRIHDYLAEHGIRLMYWSEKMLNHITGWGEGWGGAERHCKCSRKTVHDMPATYTAIDKIPTDCIAHHWYWGMRECHDEVFLSRGMGMTYGNWIPRSITNWQRRVEAGAMGAAPSHWTTLDEVTMQRNGVLLDLVFGAYLFWKTDYTDDRYDELFKASVEELYLYHNRKILESPHFEFTHMTSILRKHVYITSAPMLLERDTIGKYIVSYRSGRTLEIPIIYGVNIMNLNRNWARERDNELESYNLDASLAEVTATTLPKLQGDGTTQYSFVVPDPYPDDVVTGIQIVKTASDKGEIFMIDYKVCQAFGDNALVRDSYDPSAECLTSPII